MKLFGRHREPCNPWEDAPPWAIELGAMQLATLIQNEAILAKLERRPAKFSPEDQATLDSTFDIATGIVRKADEAEQT